ncbi:glycosyltransferase family 4 protein [Sphingosinicella soli]|uniref:Glycosyltransferase involved in cell wall biosynthesis n=1 Tax=Sphingosinicella soli TaxID=333708 RepID=A0A7W7F8A2_9SPHN|nr:glycosyltransferase family 1 protein [Sphingosinicella soli]MBB4633514.1 glycosyltransferase involved in cell wall biosynthesis [Sphingosinicella soli]
MRIAIVTDAWEPQVNGVVRTLQMVRRELERAGHIVLVLSPDAWPSLPCPGYGEIRLALATPGGVGKRLRAFGPDAIHIATEGTLGFAARRWCVRAGLAFTTAYHTHFPDYVSARTGLPSAWFWRYERWFHAPAAGVLAATPSLRRQLSAQGIGPAVPFGRGVDLANFPAESPPHAAYGALPRPIQLYVGRVAVEKNIEAFLATRHPGTRVVVGDGPARKALERQFPDAIFLGALRGAALASAYAGADVFVFPSRTDTFGMVLIEALASGVPVAAFPVQGPIDIVTPETGCLDETLDAAIIGALGKDRAVCAAYGRSFSWERAAAEFQSALVPLKSLIAA